MHKKAENIITSTIKLLVLDGIKKITMDDIAENAKVSKVTIYKYFLDKDTLYFEIARHIFAHFTDRLNNTLAHSEGLIKKLYDFMDVIGHFTESGYFKLCKELSEYNGDIDVLNSLYLQTNQRVLYALIDEGFSGNLFKDGISKDMVFHYINMGIVYYQQCPQYRHIMNSSSDFQQQFMLFYIRHIFADADNILPVL